MQQFQGGAHPFFQKFQACPDSQLIPIGHEDVFEIFLAPLFFTGTLYLLNFRSGGPEFLDKTILLFELPEVVPILSPALQLATP